MIGIVSPGRWLDDASLTRASAELVKRGYRTNIHPQNSLRLHQFAGSDAQRLTAIHEMFADPLVEAIICAKGGYGALRLIDHIDYDLIRANPKPLIGYSDITALLCANYSRARLVGFHGPMALSIAQGLDRDSLDCLFTSLRSVIPYAIEAPKSCAVRSLRKGSGAGRLIGGNLSVLANLIGTPGEPDVDGAILFVEDVDEYYYALDRLFLHLQRAGWLSRLGGLIVGRFIDMRDNEVPFGLSVDEIVLDACAGTSYPIVADAPIGHVAAPLTFPVGVSVTLTVDANSFHLEIEDPPVV
jgi:muramoyltetrapeptide carboxypeptidase